jgi:hypothetical protein
MKLKGQKAKGAKTLKKIKQKPKMLKAGTQVTSSAKKERMKQDKIKKAKTSNRLEDKHEAMASLLFGD